MRFIRELVGSKVREQKAEAEAREREAKRVASAPEPLTSSAGNAGTVEPREMTGNAPRADESGQGSMWDLDASEELAPASETPKVVAVPTPAAGRAGRRSGRVKTRLLGFEHADGGVEDVFDRTKAQAAAGRSKFPVGWIVVVEGPGRGESFSLSAGVSQIGRGDDQAIALDFGDTSISRTNHAAIAYDPEQRKFFLGHGGKANIVRLNKKPVLSTEDLSNGDLIRIGETVLRFVSLCGEDFHWDEDEDSESVAIA